MNSTGAASPRTKRQIDGLGLGGIIVGGVPLLLALTVYLVGIVPWVTLGDDSWMTIWYSFLVLFPVLVVLSPVVLVFGIIGATRSSLRKRNPALSIVAIALSVLMVAPLIVMLIAN